MCISDNSVASVSTIFRLEFGTSYDGVVHVIWNQLIN